MADGGLSIGVLSGRIDLDDNFTATITLSEKALDDLEKRFGGTNESALEVAKGMFTAEAAIEAVKEVAHLAADALAEITVQGAKVAEVETNFNRLTVASGSLSDELLGNLRQGTHSTITDFELMKSVNDTLTAGIKLTGDQYNTISTGAFALAKAKGLEVRDVFTQINDALVTGRTRGVAYLAGKIDITKAEEDYAAKLNTTADRLTADEKLEAARAAILAKVGDATQRLGEQQDGLDEKIEQARVKWANFTEDLGKSVATSPIVVKAFDDIENSITSAFGTDKEEAIQNITHAVEETAKVIADLVEDGVAVVKFMYEWRDVLEPIGVGLGTIAVGLTAVAGAEKIMALTTAFLELNPAVLAVSVAAGALYAALEIGKWQPVSDFFEKLGLEVFYGMSGAEADAAVAAHHMAEEQANAAKSAQQTADASKAAAEAAMNWKEILATLNPEIAKQAEEALTAGESAKKVGEEFHLTAAETHALQQELADNARIVENNQKKLDALTDSTRMSKKEMQDFTTTWESLNSIGLTWKDTVDTINPKIKESVQYYASLGVSVADLTKAFPGLTKAQAEAAVEGAKSAQELAKVWDETFKIIADSHGNNINDWVKEEQRRYDETVRLLQQQGKATAEMLDAELAKHNAIVDAELQKRAEGNNQTREYYQKQYDDAKATYDLLNKLGDDATAESVRNARQDMDEKERTLNHWRSAAGDAIDAVGNATDHYAERSKVAADKVGDSLDAIDMHYSKLISDALDFAQIQERNSQPIVSDRYSQDQFVKVAAELGSTADSIKGMLQGNTGPNGSLESIEAAGLAAITAAKALIASGGRSGSKDAIKNWLAMGGSLPQSLSDAMKYLSFREGGIGDFGDGTLAVLHGKEAIVPLGSGAQNFGGDTNLHFYVNGTGLQVAQQVKEIIMRELKSQRQFGAA